MVFLTIRLEEALYLEAKSYPFWMLFFNSGRATSMQFFSKSVKGPKPRFLTTPSGPSNSGVDQKSASVTSDLTKLHSTTPSFPLMASIKLKANLAPAYAIERVADPVPALALTTSVPRHPRLHQHLGEVLHQHPGKVWQ